MAKLPSVEFHHKNDTGEIMSFKSSLTLDKDGTFNISIPDELLPSAQSIKKTMEVQLSKPKNANQHRVSGKRLDDAKNFIYAVIADYMKCEVITERVICYGHSLRVAYALDDAGAIHSNGRDAQLASGKSGINGGYRWQGELHATEQAALYSVGIGAVVYDKTVFRRPSGERREYRKVSTNQNNCPAALMNLASFAGISINTDQCEEMPYSDDAALFFYDAMLAMCKLAAQVSKYLGDKETLMLAIQSRTSLLTAPKYASEATERDSQ